MTNKELLVLAQEARKNAYAPYSDFAVGAALLSTDGRVFLGCNVENHSYPAGCCAERAALFSAITAGARNFSVLAVTGWQRDGAPRSCMPCGICRQSLNEFSQDLKIITGTPENIEEYKLSDLLPFGFGV
jgi:cytidine deaminase